MSEPRALYGMCSKADTYAARETCMDLSMAMYLRPSLAAADSPRMVNVFSSLRPAKLRSSRGITMRAALAHALIGTGRTPKWACRILGRSPGQARGFLQDESRANFGVGDLCHVVGSERNIAVV